MKAGTLLGTLFNKMSDEEKSNYDDIISTMAELANDGIWYNEFDSDIFTELIVIKLKYHNYVVSPFEITEKGSIIKVSLI